MTNERQTVRVEKTYGGAWGENEGHLVFAGPIDAVITSLARIRDAIPEEYRAAARCEITTEAGPDGEYPLVRVSYYRPR